MPQRRLNLTQRTRASEAMKGVDSNSSVKNKY